MTVPLLSPLLGKKVTVRFEVPSPSRCRGVGREEMTAHGFRATARSILDEVLGFRADFIEHQLAHTVRDPNGRAYNRTAYLPGRRKMMQAWADYLDQLKADVVPIHPEPPDRN